MDHKFATGCMCRITVRPYQPHLKNGQPGSVYNVGGNSETANIDLVRTLCGLVDARLREQPELQKDFPAAPVFSGKNAVELITHVRDRPGHDRRYAIDYAKAARELDYAPAMSLKSGLAETVDWYLHNTPWWQALMSRDYADWLQRELRSLRAANCQCRRTPLQSPARQ